MIKDGIEAISVNGSSINAQTALNGSTLSSGYTNGHSTDGKIVSSQAGSNGLTQSGEYTNDYFIDGEVVNSV